MACLELPGVALPQLPSPFSIEPPGLPGISVSVAFCCKLPSFSLSFPFSLPSATINPGVIALVNTALKVIDGYLDAVPIDCPRE